MLKKVLYKELQKNDIKNFNNFLELYFRNSKKNNKHLSINKKED